MNDWLNLERGGVFKTLSMRQGAPTCEDACKESTP